jgi:hypothetical protein
VKINYGRPFDEILNSNEVRDLCTTRAERALSAARSAAPVDSGAYRASLRLEQATTDRAVARVVADVDYAMVVEARTGNLARALDAAGGS